MQKEVGNIVEAEKSYEEALLIMRGIKKDNLTEQELSILSMVRSNLGTIQYDKQDFSKAEVNLLASLQVYQKLARTNPDKYSPDVSRVLHNLGMLFLKKKDVKKAKENVLESLELYGNLAKNEPEAFNQDVNKSLFSLAEVYTEINDEELNGFPDEYIVDVIKLLFEAAQS